MTRIRLKTRYLIVIPIPGLALAAAFFLIFGSIGLIGLLFEFTAEGLNPSETESIQESGIIIFEVVEYVHNFLIGTVLFITAVEPLQLFIREIDFPNWLKWTARKSWNTNSEA